MFSFVINAEIARKSGSLETITAKVKLEIATKWLILN